MQNMLSKPRPRKFAIYIRVGSETQLTPKNFNVQMDKDKSSIMIGKTPYVLPTQLIKPRDLYNYGYKAHNLIRE